MTLFKNKYRIESARLHGWDYRWAASYFVTICTHNKEYFFGNIENSEMHLNDMGKIAWDFWMEIPLHFPRITLDAFVVMPNHIHGMLILENCTIPVVEKLPCNVSDSNQENVGLSGLQNQTLQCNVSTKMSKISPKPGSISTVLRSYKSIVTKENHKIHADFEWQERFHDHIIRDQKSFETIQNYILTNPARWSDDKFNAGR